ncbi:GH36-type glycosyl hydrolase domain-containing protein [Verrucomicrobiota bacterium]
MRKTKYGNFSKDGKEFVLKQPLLERPWMNVLSNGRWCYVASHLGGGYSFVGNPTVGRITRWHVDGVPRDTVGKFIYLRDEKNGDWWCANGYPPTRKLDSWECHIGLGYNRISSRHKGIATDITYFTPMPDAKKSTGSDIGDACELWLVKLTNTSKRRRTITATNYAELALGNWFEDTSWREFYLLFNRQEQKRGIVYSRSTQWVKYLGGWQAVNSDANNIPFDLAVFMAGSAKVTGYEGDRYEFVGPYRSLEDPQVMDSGKLRNSVATGRDACLALQHKFTLKPGESKEYVVILGGVDKDAADAGELTRRYGTVRKAKAAFKNNQAYWGKVVSTPTVKTPDRDLDMMINYWFKYQGSNLSWWNRNTGYCYSGIYNFGVRDACQDAVSRLPQDPVWVREHIVKRIMVWQFEGGDYAHGGNFLSMLGTRTFHSDDPLNPLFIMANYVHETGDYSILDEVTPYALDPSTGSGQEKKDTIYRHLVNGVEFFWSQFSKRGLPLILKADWNDALDQMGNGGKGESVMLAGWAIICIEIFYDCMRHKRDYKRLAKYKKLIAKLRKTVNKLCWDGSWYWRATHDSGWVLGSRKNKRGGMIFTNPNAFAIVAGLSDKTRTRKILASFDRYLDTEFGSYCFYPPFPEPESRAGIISRFAPGTKENGSLQGHNSRWRIWAELMAGRGDKGYEIIKKMLPSTLHEKYPDTYRIEPYIACQFTYAPESDRPGEGSHAWATGTACWTLLNVWEHMLGVRPVEEGLLVDPCLPSDWTWSKMSREYRGATYEIEIKKPRGIEKGTVRLTVDGEELSDNVIRPHGDGKVHRVMVRVTTN